jgi:hypothetical protein
VAGGTVVASSSYLRACMVVAAVGQEAAADLIPDSSGGEFGWHDYR